MGSILVKDRVGGLNFLIVLLGDGWVSLLMEVWGMGIICGGSSVGVFFFVFWVF